MYFHSYIFLGNGVHASKGSGHEVLLWVEYHRYFVSHILLFDHFDVLGLWWYTSYRVKGNPHHGSGYVLYENVESCESLRYAWLLPQNAGAVLY